MNFMIPLFFMLAIIIVWTGGLIMLEFVMEKITDGK